MAISFECTACSKKLKVPDHLAERRIKCPACQSVQTVVSAQEPPVDPEEFWEQPAAEAPAKPDPDDPFGGELFSSDDLEDPRAKSRRIAEKRSQRELERRRAEEAEAAKAMKASKKKTKSSDEAAPRQDADFGQPFRFHWIYLLALAPLALVILWPGESTETRLLRTVQNHPEVVSQLEADEETAFFDGLPGHRIEGALLGHDSLLHWVFGAISAAAYLGLLFAMFPGSQKRTIRLLLVGLFTATIGIAILLTFQILASATQGVMIRGRGLGVLIFLVVKLIGFSYRCAQDPSLGFWVSFFGFTVGVGFCEELCKALPVRHYLRNARKTGWRGACLTGLASGIGFGVSEGIMYSGNMYNGFGDGLIYLVRFVSCVSLHAMWSGSVALMMYRNQDFLDTDDWTEFLMGMAYYLSIAMVLHGLYDTLLKHDLDAVALLIGVGSYVWMTYLVRTARGT